MLLADTATLSLPTALYASLPFWPLLGAAAVGVILALGKARERAHLFVVGSVAIPAVLALLLFFDIAGNHRAKAHEASHAAPASTQPATHATQPAVAGDPGAHAPANGHAAPGDHGATHAVAAHTPIALYDWISLGNGQFIAINFFVDSLTGVMLLVVTLVGTMVVVYSIGYMKDHHGHPERGYERFFAFLGLFVFSMCMLVLAGNFVLLYLGWELVGLCSYLLIGFYYQKPEAAAAAKKAFLVNRIGDFGFALGIFAIYYYLGLGHAGVALAPGENPLDYATLFKYVGALAATPSLWGMNAADLISLLLLCGALGKSAQFPLYVWLPDAMEGPSPVSALIHAATMVTAGVYMLARCGPLYAHAEVTMVVVACIGAFGAIFAASMAMAQYDMKRIMAYSTMSQLAFMFVALACGSPDAAIFHLYTHAFFKALLFLTAGNVMHAMGNVIDLRRFSGLKDVLPTTYKLMGVGCLALSGFPLLAGFWSKDTILHAAFFSDMAHQLPWLGWVMLITATMTAYYTFRMFFLCFHGEQRLPAEAGHHPHDMGPVMQRPLYVLAFGAVAAGYLGVAFKFGGESFLGFLYPSGFFHGYLGSSTLVHAAHHAGGAWVMYLSVLLGLTGIGLAYLRYGTAPQRDPDQAALGGLWNLWHARYYVDELYQAIFVQPLRRLGDLCFAIDRAGIDGLVWFVAAVPRGAAAVLRVFQGGALQGYALSMVVGLAILAALWRWMDTPLVR